MKMKVVKKSNNINCNLSRHKKSEANRNIISKDFFFFKKSIFCKDLIYLKYFFVVTLKLLKIHQWSFL